jgi:PAS domain S-box-containing protein
MSNKLGYTNFDKINKIILNVDKPFNNINHISLENNKFDKLLQNLNKSMKDKIDIIEKLKSLKAVLNNSTQFMQNLKISNKDFFQILLVLAKMDIKKSINYSYELAQLNNIEAKTNNDYIFKMHALRNLFYFKQYSLLQNKVSKLNINKKINDLNNYYYEYENKHLLKYDLIVLFLFIFLFIAIIVFFILSYFANKQEITIHRFTNVLNSSDNSILIFDYNRIIKYINKSFLESVNYSNDFAIGKNLPILKSSLNTDKFYDDMFKTIYSGKQWSGTFKREDKDSNIIHERSTITPISQNGNIVEFMTIKLNITEDINRLNLLRKNEKILQEQSKMASMGEMISNIAHQWRQPLSSISTISTGNIVKKDLGLLNDKDFISSMNKINDASKFLSNTIDDFRNFFNKDKNSEEFNLGDCINTTLSLIDSLLNTKNIQIIKNEKVKNIIGFKNELMQVLINIINNAKDALIENKIEDKLIFIDTYDEDNYIHITIKDNANGIPENVIKMIFEPYFTTKRQAKGTGIGLYMSYRIITQNMFGELSAKNTTYMVDNKQYTGAQFTIKIPKRKKE